MRNQTRILDKVIARGMAVITATVTDFVDMGDGLMKVMATFSGLGSKQEMRAALAAAVDNMGQAIHDSFMAVAGTEVAAVGFMLANPEVRPFNDPSVAKMKAITANILMDDQDKVWSVRDTAAGKCLVRTSESELPAVMASVRRRAVGVPVIASLDTPNVRATEFLTYATTAGLQRGFALSTVDGEVCVMNMNGEEEVIAEEQIVDVRQIDDDALEEITAATVPTTTDKATMKDYYSKVFGYNPEYLKQFLEVIDGNKVL